LIVAVPFGILADRRGRRFVCILGVIGITLGQSWFYVTNTYYTVFPLWSVFLYSAFFFIGGSGEVLAATMLAIVADVVPAAKR
jgi:MFS family permease